MIEQPITRSLVSEALHLFVASWLTQSLLYFAMLLLTVVSGVFMHLVVGVSPQLATSCAVIVAIASLLLLPFSTALVARFRRGLQRKGLLETRQDEFSPPQLVSERSVAWESHTVESFEINEFVEEEPRLIRLSH